MLKKIKIVSVLVGSRFPGDIGGDSDDGVVLLLEVAVDDLVDRGVGVLDGDGGDARVRRPLRGMERIGPVGGRRRRTCATVGGSARDGADLVRQRPRGRLL